MPPPADDQDSAAPFADDWDEPTEAEILAEASDRRSKLGLIGIGLFLGLAVGVLIDPSMPQSIGLGVGPIQVEIPLSRASSGPPVAPGAANASRLVILVTVVLCGWSHWRTSRCPACDGYLRRGEGSFFSLSRFCPHCHARLR